jgi:hypothetical protein
MFAEGKTFVADDTGEGMRDEKIAFLLEVKEGETLHMLSVKPNRDDCIKLSVDKIMFWTRLRL